MRLEYQILAAVALDLLLGDPQWLPHPVRAIGALAARLETVARRIVRKWGQVQFVRSTGHRPKVGRAVPANWTCPLFLAGLVTALAVYAAAGVAAWGAIRLASLVHPWAGDVTAILVIYTTLAARDLARHSMAVFKPLAMDDLPEARRRVAAIVGRDTQRLDASGVVRAAVESVAESTVDGVTAPLFFAALAGPVGAMVYRAVNTLDSMFGHQDERYGRFGWAAARIDDAANYLPARLTAPVMCLAAFLLRQRAAHAVGILRRDGRNHASPNSGLTEAAMAGALGVQLGGVNFYDGQPLVKPTIGDPLTPLSLRHIPLANALMFLTTACYLIGILVVRAESVHLWHVWRAAG